MLAWLDLQKEAINVQIENTREYKREREYQIGRHIADRAIPEKKLVFEYVGCHNIGHSCILNQAD